MNQLNFLRKDYCELVAPRCGKCKMAIVENFLSAMNKYWHVSCFVCFVSCLLNVSVDYPTLMSHY